MDDDFYTFHSMHDDSPEEYVGPEAISMDTHNLYYQQLKEPANVLYDYYNNPDLEYSNPHHQNNNDPKMIMIQQINQDENIEKDWSEEDLSDLDELKNDILPSSMNKNDNNLLNTNNRLQHSRINRNVDPSQPHYVNVTDLINDIGFGMFCILCKMCKDT